MFRIEKKIVVAHSLRNKIISVVMALIVAAVFIAICGYNPFVVYREMLKGSFCSAYNISQMIEQMIPLLLMALGVAVCFKMQFINIGAEGQFCMGAIGATAIALFVKGLPAPVAIVLMFVVAFLSGGLWCLIAGVLKSKWRVSETLVTLMLTYVALKIVAYLQYVAWKDPDSFGMPKIANYPESLQFPTLLGVQSGWIIAVITIICAYFLLHKTRLGYEISIMGNSEKTARYAGINTRKILLITSLIGGGVCGLAGMIQACGVEHTLNASMSGGWGYIAVVIAYMAGMEPIPITVVSFLFSILLQGSDYMQISIQIPTAAGSVIQGIILLFVLAGEFFVSYRIVRVKKAEK